MKMNDSASGRIDSEPTSGLIHRTHAGHHDEGDSLLEEFGEPLQHRLLHRVDIADDARDEFTGVGIVVVGERLLFELGEDRLADVAHEPLPDFL